MDAVFAPWRIEWVERADKNEDVEECIFCEIHEWDDNRENLVVAQNEHAFVLLNNYPYSPGHAMVIPFEHGGDYAALSEDVLVAHAKLKQRTFDALEEAFRPDGFNAGLNLGEGAGGSVDNHLHTHIVPRWSGDTNFMPVISDTKVVVEALEDSYDRLHNAFAGQEGATLVDENSAVRFD